MKVKQMMHKGVQWVSPDTPVSTIAKPCKSMTSAQFRGEQ